jgi:hypothetical protein
MTKCLIDDAVGEDEDVVWHVDSDGASAPEIDHQLEFHRHLNRQISRFGAAQDTIDVGGRPGRLVDGALERRNS